MAFINVTKEIVKPHCQRLARQSFPPQGLLSLGYVKQISGPVVIVCLRGLRFYHEKRSS
jgi:hypothetical protein